MLDINFIRENPGKIKECLKNRGMSLDIDKLLELDEQRRELICKGDELRHEKNKTSDKIAQLKAKEEDASNLINSMKKVSQMTKEIENELKEIEKKLDDLLINIPNMPHESVSVGLDEESNKFIKEWGSKREFDYKPLTHIELAENLDIIDFKRPTKITGSNYILYKGLGARLERALIDFMIDVHIKKHGYTEIFPPFVVNRDSMENTGQLPKLEEDMYRIEKEDYFLIPTAEVPVTNIYKNEEIEENDLPIKYVAYTPCFRREAGSYGKQSKGLVRVHQFDKVEMVNFVPPTNSYDRLEKLLKEAEKIMQLLKLPYRVISLSTGDISFAAAKCYDIEVWSSGLERYLEVSSCSNFEDFQARRANIKFRDKESQDLKFIHTLNGSGVALARTVIALLENYQQKDGSICIPKVLQPYMETEKIGP